MEYENSDYLFTECGPKIRELERKGWSIRNRLIPMLIRHLPNLITGELFLSLHFCAVGRFRLTYEPRMITFSSLRNCIFERVSCMSFPSILFLAASCEPLYSSFQPHRMGWDRFGLFNCWGFAKGRGLFYSPLWLRLRLFWKSCVLFIMVGLRMGIIEVDEESICRC